MAKEHRSARPKGFMRNWTPIPRQVMDLCRVDPRECIVLDPRRPQTMRGHDQAFLDSLLHLGPMKHRYSPVTPAERRSYPIST